jgi:ankyrin repeat protein
MSGECELGGRQRSVDEFSAWNSPRHRYRHYYLKRKQKDKCRKRNRAMTTTIENAMFMAAKAGYADQIKDILSTGKGNWNVTDALGNTPLHYAAGEKKNKTILSIEFG